jgi:hypothetical protein
VRKSAFQTEEQWMNGNNRFGILLLILLFTSEEKVLGLNFPDYKSVAKLWSLC